MSKIVKNVVAKEYMVTVYRKNRLNSFNKEKIGRYSIFAESAAAALQEARSRLDAMADIDWRDCDLQIVASPVENK